MDEPLVTTSKSEISKYALLATGSKIHPKVYATHVLPVLLGPMKTVKGFRSIVASLTGPRFWMSMRMVSLVVCRAPGGISHRAYA